MTASDWVFRILLSPVPWWALFGVCLWLVWSVWGDPWTDLMGRGDD